MDDERSDVLSAGVNQFLDAARDLGTCSPALPSGQHRHADGLCDSALAGVAALERARRMARCRVVGVAPGTGGVGGVDHRIEKHAVRFVLSARHLVLVGMAQKPGADEAERK